MRVYVATSFATRERVHAFMARLRERVPDAALAYDWTTHTQADDPGDVAWREFDGVVSAAEVFVALLPGGPGTYSEIGLAVGKALRPGFPAPIIVGSIADERGWRECPILHLCTLVDTEREAIEIIARRALG